MTLLSGSLLKKPPQALLKFLIPFSAHPSTSRALSNSGCGLASIPTAGRSNLLKSSFELQARFVNAYFASGFYESLALRFGFLRLGLLTISRRASNFGLGTHCGSLSISCRSVGQALADHTADGGV